MELVFVHNCITGIPSKEHVEKVLAFVFLFSHDFSNFSLFIYNYLGASLGETCGEDQACKGDYTICGSSGVCECDSRQGTRPDYRGRNCIRNFSVQRLGEPCFDSTQCYSRTMQCKYNQCICQNGTIPLNRYECATSNLLFPLTTYLFIIKKQQLN